MPVEIRELIIRAYADETPEADRPKKADDVLDREDIIAECVEQIMEILKRGEER